jgi:hypothetical protein
MHICADEISQVVGIVALASPWYIQAWNKICELCGRAK